MPEVVHQPGLHALRHRNALRNGNDDCLMLCHFLLHVMEKTLRREVGLRHIDQMRRRFAVGVQHGAGCGEPSGMASHDLHDSH